MRRVGIQTKALAVTGGLIGLFVLFVAASLVYLRYLEKGFSLVSNKIYPTYEKALNLSSQFRSSKNWLVRYVIETDPEKIELWKKNYENNFKQTLNQFQKIEDQSDKSLKESIVKMKDHLNLFSEKVRPIIEKHEDHLAKVAFMAALMKEHSKIIEAIQFHLNHASSGISGQKLLNKIQELSVMASNMESIIKEPLILPLEIKTESELNALLKEKRTYFDSKLLSFNQTFEVMLSSLKESSAKKELREAKLSSLKLSQLVLSEGGIFDLLKQDIDDYLFIWKTIEDVNKAYESVDKKTVLFSQQIKEKLDASIRGLKIARKKSHFFFMLLLIFSVCFIFILHYFVKTRVLAPLNNLSTIALKVEEGNLELREPVPEQEDEIRDLVLSFNSMIDKLSRSRKQLCLATEEIIFQYKKIGTKMHEPSVSKVGADFFENMSHEFRSPLAIIKQAIENLKSGALTKEQIDKTIEIENRAVDRLKNLVTIYVDLSEKKVTKKAA